MSDSGSFPDGRHLAVGLMSGTSVDGIDAALVETIGEGGNLREIRLLEALVHPMDETLRTEIFALFDRNDTALDRFAVLDHAIGEAFAQATLALLSRAGRTPREIAVIGSHGQTIRHVAGVPGSAWRGSLQAGSGDVIAQRTGIVTASDFRSADIAAGGTGAPLLPFFDRIMAARFESPVAFQNFGGIGNLCWVDAAGALIAFDTGPGNMVADRLALLASGGKLRYDRDGTLGAAGRIREDIIDRWMAHPFFVLRPPKSAGREDFGSDFFAAEIEPFLGTGKDEADAVDLLRTAESFVARSTAAAYRSFLPSLPRSIIVTGGGARNPHIMHDFQTALPECRVVPGDEVGISVDYKEAEAFALFGLLRLYGLPNTDPRATGASRAVSAGKLSLP
ncbi:MAG: anhydro-N-acetylmuramic acid kinase [Rectinemataceae bacterium]